MTTVTVTDDLLDNNNMICDKMLNRACKSTGQLIKN